MEDETVNNVMCQFTDPEGTTLGAPLYLPQNAGPHQLQQIVNKLLNNVSFGFDLFCNTGYVLVTKNKLKKPTESRVFLDQEEKLPYAFYISDQELAVPLETYLHKNKGWWELKGES